MESRPIASTAETVHQSFVGEPLIPERGSFSAVAMAGGKPGLPPKFSWRGRELGVSEVLEEWKETGPCSHGSGEHYVRKHWFRIRTADNQEMRLYFERQSRTSRGSRWRLYSIVNAPVAPAGRSS